MAAATFSFQKGIPYFDLFLCLMSEAASATPGRTPTRRVHDALCSTAGKGLNSWLSFVMSNCDVTTFSLVSWVRCGAWLYRVLIFALFPTLFKVLKTNQHQEQDTNGKVTTSQLDITNESQEVSPLPAVDHKASINRRASKHSKNKTEIT